MMTSKPSALDCCFCAMVVVAAKMIARAVLLLSVACFGSDDAVA